MTLRELKTYLDKKVDEYNQPSFIKNDPISIPHLFTKKQDIEIAGFFAAIFSWGNRTTIINKSRELLNLMGKQPYEFCINHSPTDLKKLRSFKHRTFNTDDLYYFIDFFCRHFKEHDSLETAFFPKVDMSTEEGLNHFKQYFFAYDHLKRTEKHISSPLQKSTCKRVNMFLRWMIRNDKRGVDFGLWKNIKPSALICPIDVHVARVARKMGLIKRKQTDWQTALELTEALRKLDKDDPVKYDFALFSLGVIEKF
ncbi:MAG: TIGR02757 family protein [Bacteroidetes bacterium]|nr:MAG: TIGR02757 family protein [Bacteroidota bacterium]